MPEGNKAPSRKAPESAVESIAETGKVVAEIAKGAATKGWYGAAAAAVKTSKKWLGPVVLMLIVPILIVTMLPSIIFGPLLSDGSDEKSGIADDAVLEEKLLALNESISTVLSEGLQETLSEIEIDFASSGCDSYEISNPYGSDVRFNANYFLSLYCASKESEPESISKEDLESVIRRNKGVLYSFTFEDEVRLVEVAKHDDEADDDEEPELVEITVRHYTIRYNGESYFADEVFHLDDEQKKLARSYAQNLSILLRDGSYQVLSEADWAGFGSSFAGAVFTDGQVPVVYYSQGDERWRDLPYGTDNIGGYACGPTAMAMVVSSLTEYAIDPPTMSDWAYANGHWCSGNGSYQTIITGACEKWGLNVEPCGRDESTRIKTALRSGKLIVAVMGPGHFTKSGHFIVLRGITGMGKILVADPASYSRSQQEWELKTITDEASTYSLLTAPFWIIGG